LARPSRQKLIVGALVLLLATSVAGNLLLYRQASRPLHTEGDRPLIERTAAHFAAIERTTADEIMTDSFPIVLHLADRTCVELRHIGGMGHRGACYDRQGELLEETASVTG
jgi:hypothetical protein